MKLLIKTQLLMSNYQNLSNQQKSNKKFDHAHSLTKFLLITKTIQIQSTFASSLLFLMRQFYRTLSFRPFVLNNIQLYIFQYHRLNFLIHFRLYQICTLLFQNITLFHYQLSFFPQLPPLVALSNQFYVRINKLGSQEVLFIQQYQSISQHAQMTPDQSHHKPRLLHQLIQIAYMTIHLQIGQRSELFLTSSIPQLNSSFSVILQIDNNWAVFQ